MPPAFGGKIQKIKNNDYSSEFPLRLMSKNMDLVMVAAKTSGAGLPAARVAQSVLSSNLYRPLAQSEIKRASSREMVGPTRRF